MRSSFGYQGQPFVLVLPPWGGLYHWKQKNIKLKWSEFFDVGSLDEFVPVLEFEDYLQVRPHILRRICRHFCPPWKSDEYIYGIFYILPYEVRAAIETMKKSTAQGTSISTEYFRFGVRKL
ncbi:hypothetical protein DICVIV_06039 [Dictyocaulus viviparus]|uniref:GDP-fucose protein O-fucosyltransferase 2 n=1 Tax=Dictyocaulus viviparus TaxID=29172 RepID=A0A0D8XVN9_DICVI|nr:hypothetical protein DICVIV_06039 [Dictyocaulus viviparus]